MADRYIGKRLDGRYEVLEMIGSGGMANVYRAHDRLENTDVAVKILREEFLGNEDFVRRFKNESKAISLLSHPNIVRVFDVNFSDTIQCIVMELIDGITLKDYISRQGQLGWRDAVFFTEQILKALQHAHDRGIIHRDIKPQNIMLMPDGSIKVMDFGIARFSRSETRTITDKAIGSVHYISPEQAKGDTTDAKADIYSTGVMMYEMLTGRLPFESDSPVSVAIKQISDTPQSIREIDDTIPLALEEITFKAMAKDPAKRYQSAAQMLRDIDEFKRNPSIKFAYKYLSDDAPTRYVESAKAVRPLPPAPKSRRAKKRGGAFIIVSLSITLACVIGTAILIYMVLNLNGVLGETEDVSLPSFIGMNINEVRKNSDLSFKWEIEEEYNSVYGTGVIFDQTPVEKMVIKSGGTVKLKVSKGVEMVSIPMIKGMPMSDAVSLLRDKNLVVSVMLESDESVAEGQAFRTSPENGETVPAGSLVTLYINPALGGGSGNAYMPDVVGMPVTDARAKLAANRIKIKEIIYEESDVAKGIVFSQDMPKNHLVPYGAGVTLKVSEGPSERPFSWKASLPYSVGGNTTYNVEVKLNGQSAHSTSVSKGPTSKTFDFVGKGEATITVFVNGKLLYEVRINFDDGSSKVVTDNKGNFEMHKPDGGNNGGGGGGEGETVNKDALNNAISAATSLMGSVTVTEDGSGLPAGTKWMKPGDFSALENARNNGQAVSSNSSASQSEVDNATSAINSAMSKVNTSSGPSDPGDPEDPGDTEG